MRIYNDLICEVPLFHYLFRVWVTACNAKLWYEGALPPPPKRRLRLRFYDWEARCLSGECPNCRVLSQQVHVRQCEWIVQFVVHGVPKGKIRDLIEIGLSIMAKCQDSVHQRSSSSAREQPLTECPQQTSYSIIVQEDDIHHD